MTDDMTDEKSDEGAACGLADKRCSACTKATPKLTDEQILAMQQQTPKWTLLKSWSPAEQSNRITREFKLRNWAAAIGFVNAVSVIAEGENHHPDVELHKYRMVRLTLTTHAIKSLSENDFIVAAKIDALAADNPNILQ